MKKGALIRLVSRKTRFSDPEIASNYSYMEYRIPKEEQEIGIVIQEGDEYVKQMKVLSRKTIRFWFIHHCEVINENR